MKIIQQASLFVALSLALVLGLPAQLQVLSRDQRIDYTRDWKGDRFEDGRPRVPDSVLEKVRGLSAEEVFAVLPGKGYPNQYEDGFQLLHPDKKLVGRAFTVQFMPRRPDLEAVIQANAKARGLESINHQSAMDMLQPGDVFVVDMFNNSNIVGDNLFYYIMRATKTGGLVVDGGIRDLEGLARMDMAAYFRSASPPAIGSVMLTGINVPVRIGKAIVMPGDIVLGDREGVYFIPPHLVEEVIDRAEITHLHDEWTRKKFDAGTYKSSDIYANPRDAALIREYEDYLKQRLGREAYERHVKEGQQPARP